MATEIYKISNVLLVDDTEIVLSPLKIKYLRQVMDRFLQVKEEKVDSLIIEGLMDCVLISMKQYYPKIKTMSQLEDSIDMPTVYKVLEVGAGIAMGSNDKEEDGSAPNISSQGSSWEELDLAKLESELFLLGIWKDYDELETSLSMPEMLETLKAKRDADYNEKKFFAAIQGVDLDKNQGGGDEWEKLKARVFSKGKTDNPNDITTFTGSKAAQAGFGINNGLTYERIE